MLGVGYTTVRNHMQEDFEGLTFNILIEITPSGLAQGGAGLTNAAKAAVYENPVSLPQIFWCWQNMLPDVHS